MRLTVDEYQRTAARLVGQTVVAVAYFPLMGGEEGLTVHEWDAGAWHEPTMGVELTTVTGEVYSAVWGHSFDYHGLELFPTPMTEHLRSPGTPGGSARINVTDHAQWADIVGQPVSSADIIWSTEPEAPPTPAAVHLRTAAGQVWIAAGRPATWPPNAKFYLYTDDVLVVFNDVLAEQIGLVRALGRPGKGDPLIVRRRSGSRSPTSKPAGPYPTGRVGNPYKAGPMRSGFSRRSRPTA